MRVFLTFQRVFDHCTSFAKPIGFSTGGSSFPNAPQLLASQLPGLKQ